jgi:hypothetical protein
MRKINLQISKPLAPDLVQRLIDRFNYCRENNKLTEVRIGDERIFYFENFIDNDDAKFLFNRHLEYCDSIGVNRPAFMTLMINRTWYHAKAIGSGAGWHRDSGLQSQHKTFSYLSDVGEDNGPFVINDHQNYLLSLLDNPRIRQKEDFKIKIKSKDVIYKKMLGPKGYSFSCCTNFVHRGLPVISDERYMVTVYAWNKLPPEPFKEYFSQE